MTGAGMTTESEYRFALAQLPKEGDESVNDQLQAFESLVVDLSEAKFVFRLFVSGASSRSAVAVANIRGICEQYLAGRYEMEVIDIYQEPDAIRTAQVIAVPTLIKELPLPAQRFVGDMSDTERIVVGLSLKH